MQGPCRRLRNIFSGETHTRDSHLHPEYSPLRPTHISGPASAPPSASGRPAFPGKSTWHLPKNPSAPLVAAGGGGGEEAAPSCGRGRTLGRKIRPAENSATLATGYSWSWRECLGRARGQRHQREKEPGLARGQLRRRRRRRRRPRTALAQGHADLRLLLARGYCDTHCGAVPRARCGPPSAVGRQNHPKTVYFRWCSSAATEGQRCA